MEGASKVGAVLTSIRPVAAVLGVTVAILAFSSGRVPAQSNCQWYGTTALKQQQENVRLGCSFSGPAWSSDLKGHMAWCGSVPPDTWRQMAQKREQELAACAAKKR